MPSAPHVARDDARCQELVHRIDTRVDGADEYCSSPVRNQDRFFCEQHYFWYTHDEMVLCVHDGRRCKQEGTNEHVISYKCTQKP
eukprot:1790675-Pleurochrysis_carterae.AAC.1